MARPRLHDEKLAEELLQQAATMISVGGPDSLSVRKVSQAANTSTSAVYSLYGSREALLTAVYERAARGFAGSQNIEPSGSAADDIIEHSLSYRRWALENPNLYPVMFAGRSGAQDNDMRAMSQSTIKPLVAAVQRAIDEGFFRESNAIQVAVAMWTCVHGYVALELENIFTQMGDRETDPDQAYVNFTLTTMAFWVKDIDALRQRVKVADGASW